MAIEAPSSPPIVAALGVFLPTITPTEAEAYRAAGCGP
jgi:hypothetical protein